MRLSQRNAGIDLAKFIAALLVIGIHTQPFSELSTDMDFFFQNIIFRLAVPFFVVCTGYYLTLSLVIERGCLSSIVSNKMVFKNVCLKLLKLYVGWSFFYLFILAVGWVENGAFKLYFIGWCKSLCIGLSYFHLWYLFSVLLALIGLYVLLLKVPIKYRYHLISILWICEVIEYAYRPILFNNSDFWNLFELFGVIPISITRMLPLLLIGVCTALNNNKKEQNVRAKSILVFVLLCIEVYVLRALGGEKFSYVIFTLPMSYYLFSIILSIRHYTPVFDTRILAKISLVVYCLHPAVIWALQNIEPDIHPFSLFIYTCFITTGLSILYYRIKEKIVRYS